MIWFHHILIHFPIALGTAAFLFAVLSVILRKPVLATVAHALLVAAACFAVPAVISGLLSTEHWSEDIIAGHRLAGIITASLLVIAGIRSLLLLKKERNGSIAILLIITLIIAIAVGITGHLGGGIVHPNIAPF